MNFDKFLDKKYNSKNYNCLHFVKDVYKELFEIDIENVFRGLFDGPGCRKPSVVGLEQLSRLERPISPCIALFQANRRSPHVGIWLGGRILHLSTNGAEWTPLESFMLDFNKVRFYNVK